MAIRESLLEKRFQFALRSMREVQSSILGRRIEGEDLEACVKFYKEMRGEVLMFAQSVAHSTPPQWRGGDTYENLLRPKDSVDALLFCVRLPP